MSFLKKIFGKEEKLDPIDLSRMKVDFHSHLIPNIDDGSKSMEESIQMLKTFKKLGYQKVITTPHVMSDFYKNESATILDGRDQIRKQLKELKIDIEFEAAAEYYLDESLEDKIAQGDILTFGDKYVLFELPFFSEPPNLSQIIFQFQTNGYKPILAHPERYGFWYKDFEKYRELKDKGVLLQLNILSLIGHYSPETQKISEKLIKEDLISFLGSDCHNYHHLELIEIARRKKSLHDLMNSGLLLNQSL